MLRIICLFVFVTITLGLMAQGSQDEGFEFNNSLRGNDLAFSGSGYTFVEGLEGEAIRLSADSGYSSLRLDGTRLDEKGDFSVHSWVKTNSKDPMVLFSQKKFDNKGIISQKNKGWVVYCSEGAFGFSVGSGERRINYERDNGYVKPVSDGQWHHLAITFRQAASEFRLYLDGKNIAIYKVNFDFGNDHPILIGTRRSESKLESGYTAAIIEGQKQLQIIVDQFNKLGLERLLDVEFIDLIVDPRELIRSKRHSTKEEVSLDSEIETRMLKEREKLKSNPYTVFQNRALTLLKPISKIYELQQGRVIIKDDVAREYTQQEKLFPADFAIDKFSIKRMCLSAQTIQDTYAAFRTSRSLELADKQENLTVAAWNIWHGGIHWSEEQDGWDSRKRIAEIIKDKEIDVLLMQETYSAGDFIAAELGYYFATTSDWDYCYQGANISVISRFPIKEVKVLEETEFNNVGVRISISKSQDIWSMSNWYGMKKFPDVFDFHRSRFDSADLIPVLFGGDFNAVPHTDGGDSPASERLLEEGFVDAYRHLYPDVLTFPGHSHRSGNRIDQLYFKGANLQITAAETISTWPGGFPSDHYLIVSKFRFY